MDRYEVVTTLWGSFLLDTADGSVVAVFSRETHYEDAMGTAALWNDQDEPMRLCRRCQRDRCRC